MKLLLSVLGLLLGTIGPAAAYHCQSIVDEITNSTSLTCAEISDGDFPIQLANSEHAGHYDSLNLFGVGYPFSIGNLTSIPAEAVNGVTFNELLMVMENVVSINEGFLTTAQQSSTIRLQLRNFRSMRTYPWQSLSTLSKLEQFTLAQSGLTKVEENVSWPKTVRNIDLGYNNDLTLVKSNAFKSASGLQTLSMWSSSSKIVFEEQSLYTTASNPQFELYFYGSNISTPMFADDAFGNVHGGQLWGRIVMGGKEFREKTFRLLLKAKFDKNADHLMESNFGPISLSGCTDDCTHAWVYQDAKKYGIEEYKRLLGGFMTDVYCPEGPILSGGDPSLYTHFESCPETPMPWPHNYCKDVPGAMDVTEDLQNCHCFYYCNNHEVAGHECCKPGLAFNPVLKACDWAYNVPNCD